MNKRFNHYECCNCRYSFSCNCRCCPNFCYRNLLPIRNSVSVCGNIIGLDSVANIEIRYISRNQRFTVNADSNGHYCISVPFASDLTIIPTQVADYIVSPANYQYTSLKRNKQNCDFIYRRTEVVISGNIIGLDNVSGIAIDYIVDNISYRTYTNAEGFYSFNVAGGSRVLINSAAVLNYSVAPSNYTFETVVDDINNCDFTYYLNEIALTRATSTVSAYASAPNTWPLHGEELPNLFMLDKVLISLPPLPVTSVKWELGIRDVAYFVNGGGNDITNTYRQGFPVNMNQEYTVYALLENGYESIATINIDNIRDGSSEMPYLLIDFATIESLKTEIAGIEQFSLFYMQGSDGKLTKHYEIYEDINMINQNWQPLGTVNANYPYDIIEGFTGSLVGNNHQISNLSLGNKEVDQVMALFAAAQDNAIIKDLTLNNCQVASSVNGAGFVAFTTISNGDTILLENLHFNGNIDSFYAASICSYSRINNGTLVINNCHTGVNINCITYGGGISGFNYLGANGNLSVSNCTSSGKNVSTADDNAGIVAYCQMYGQTCQITNCFSSMELEGYGRLGGIIGSIIGSATRAIVSSCGNSGEIRSQTSAGGISASVILRDELTCMIENCYNNGRIILNQAPSSWNSGGIIGAIIGPATIQNCYNCGNVVSTTLYPQFQLYIAGISGRYHIVENCASIGEEVSNTKDSIARIAYFPLTITGTHLSNNIAFEGMRVLINGAQKVPLVDTADGIDGESVASSDLTIQDTYENRLGWDFENIWSFGNGDYQLPILRGIPAEIQPIVMPSYLV